MIIIPSILRMTHSGYFMVEQFMIETEVDEEYSLKIIYDKNLDYCSYRLNRHKVKSITNISDNSKKTGIKKYKVGISYIERPTITYYKLEEVAFNNELHFNIQKGYVPNGSRAVTTYHPNGEIHEKYFLVNNRRNGTYISYTDYGAKQKTIDYIDGKLNGPSIIYGRFNITEETSYVDDKIHGSHKRYSPNGDLVEDSKYINGELIKDK